MNSDRIKEIQKTTAYPESVSVMLALTQVWNECKQEQNKILTIPSGSISMANDKAIEYAKLKHGDEYKDQAFERDVAETEIDFARGFIACYEYFKNNES